MFLKKCEHLPHVATFQLRSFGFDSYTGRKATSSMKSLHLRVLGCTCLISISIYMALLACLSFIFIDFHWQICRRSAR